MSDLIAKQRYVENFPLADLKPHPKNPRLHDLASIDESIENLLFAGAIYAQEGTCYVLSGHGRINVLTHKGVTHAPVIFVECNDRRAEQYVVAFNHVGERSTYDVDLLNQLVGGLAAAGALLGTGYSPDDADDLLAQAMGGLETELQDFTGDYVESPEELAARAAKIAQGKEAAGLSEVVLVLDQADRDAFDENVAVIEDFHNAGSTSENVRIAVQHYADELREDAIG